MHGAGAAAAASFVAASPGDVNDDDAAMCAALAAAESASTRSPSVGAASGDGDAARAARPVRAAGAAAAAALAANATADGEASAAPRARPGVPITAEQAQATHEWLGSTFQTVGGRWPKNDARQQAINAKLEEIGITAAQARLQLGKVRMERRGRATTADQGDPRSEYRDMLYAALDEDAIVEAAFGRVRGGEYLAQQPALRALFNLARTAGDTRGASNDLLYNWCCASAESWVVGGTGAPLSFIVARQQRRKSRKLVSDNSSRWSSPTIPVDGRQQS